MRIVRESFLFSGTKGRRSVEKKRVRTGAENMLPEAVFFRAARMRPETGWKMLRGMAKLQRERSTGNEHTL